MEIELKILNKEFYGYRQGKHSINDPIDQAYSELLPSYATSGSAGIDLICCEDLTLYPGETKAIHTGIAIWVGSSSGTFSGYAFQDQIRYMGMIVPRSGLGTQGLVLANTVGIIDSDYQGELIIQAWNRKDCNQYRELTRDGGMVVKYNPINEIYLKAGQKIAQLVFIPIIKAEWEIVDEFSHITKRGTGSFGSTGE